ncbi:MAG: Rid family hydrolase, partial [Halobacteriales archaeon]|nr:Rid family hydrolase [Halobacteriales archaeon]
VTAGDWVVTAGVTGKDAKTGVPDDFESQVHQAYDNLRLALESGGSSLDDMVHTRTYLTDMQFADEYREIKKEILGDSLPTNSLVSTSALADPRMYLEVEAIGIS